MTQNLPGNALPTADAPPRELFVFVHMPKTGGQTLRKLFTKQLELHRTFIHLGPAGVRDENALSLPPFEQRSPEERARARVILGHYVTIQTHTWVPGTVVRHVFLLREPAETLVSYYNFQMQRLERESKPLVDFETWYDKSKRGNMMTRWVLTEFLREPHPRDITRLHWDRVQAALREFWFVGCTEHIDRDLPLLLARMGLTAPENVERANVGGVHYKKTLELDPKLRDRLRAENALDVELYEYWRDRLPQTLDRLRRELADMRSSQTQAAAQSVA